MKYWTWRIVEGKYVWRHEDGTARTLLPLDYNWAQIYEIITKDADLYFMNWDIPCNVQEFTDRFIAHVSTAWFRYKTTFELFSGTLDGSTINPNMFEAGYTRTTHSKRDITDEYEDNRFNKSNNKANSIQESYTDNLSGTENSKQRNLNYTQGVQALENINNGNIGELGNKYASGIMDTVANGSNSSENVYGERNVSAESNQEDNITTYGDSSNNDIFDETVHETRINYYDNLAFLRERADRIKMLTPFYKEFEQFFNNVDIFPGNW